MDETTPCQEPPDSPHGGTPPTNEAHVRVGSTQFRWPVPDKVVVIAERRLSLEIAVVAALYAVVGLWILWSVRTLPSALGDLLSALFSGDGFTFAFAWVISFVLLFIAYVAVGALYIAFRLVRGDPVGRGLALAVFVVATLLLFTSARSAALWVTFLVAGVCCAVLFFSPWAARVFAEGRGRRGRPTPVVVAQTVTVSYFSLLGLMALLGLPGVRFVGGAWGLGIGYVFFVLFAAAAAAAAWVGYVMLNRGPDKTGRLLVSGAAAVVLVGQFFMFTGPSFVVALGVAAGILVPLWVLPNGRAWFGEQPLSGLNVVRIETGAGPASRVEDNPETP